jgi:aldose 1-epimerase
MLPGMNTFPRTVLLQAEGSPARAEILVGRGCACASAILESPQGPRDVLWAPDDYTSPAGRPSAGGIPILCPYPGRLASTTMEFQGQSFSLPPGDQFGRPIHGLAHDRPWRIVEQQGNRLVAEFRLSIDAPEATASWPADFTLSATWTLFPNRLDLDLDLLAHGTMPAALGLHPYHPVPVIPGADADACQIEIPATRFQPQEQLLPVGSPVAAHERIAFPGRVPLGGVSLDDPFCGLSAEAEGSPEPIVTRLIDPASGATIRAAWSSAFSACVIFTPPHRKAVCIEPYTVLPGQRTFAPAAGWQILEAGQRLGGRYSVSTG